MSHPRTTTTKAEERSVCVCIVEDEVIRIAGRHRFCSCMWNWRAVCDDDVQ